MGIKEGILDKYNLRVFFMPYTVFCCSNNVDGTCVHTNQESTTGMSIDIVFCKSFRQINHGEVGKNNGEYTPTKSMPAAVSHLAKANSNLKKMLN